MYIYMYVCMYAGVCISCTIKQLYIACRNHMRDIMTFMCRRKLKVVVYFVVATFLFVDITQKFSPSYQVQECVPKASLSLATGVVKPAVNPAGESQSLDHVIYPEVTVVPRIVYYLWCDNKTFEFKHYLSVLSVVRFVRPERIVFEYGARPPIDRYMYNTWLVELMDTLSYLELQEMTSRRHADVCRDERSRRAYIVTKIRRDGGIFVGKNTIFTRELRGLTETSTTKLLSSYEGYFMSKSQNLDAEKDSWPSLCLRASDYESRKPNASDITTHVCEYRTIYPRDIMSGGDAFASLARSLFYGDSAAPTPHSDSQRLIPNIAHMLWIGGTRIDFLFYLSALSLLYVVNVERLFIHGDLPPSGHYWRRLEGQARITYVPCAKPNVAFGHISGSKHHMSDIFRAQVGRILRISHCPPLMPTMFLDLSSLLFFFCDNNPTLRFHKMRFYVEFS